MFFSIVIPTYNNAEVLWEDFLSKHPNIFMVLCGHVDSDDVVVSKQIGDYGNVVTQVLIDPQSMDAEYAQGSKGMVAMLYFSNDGKTMTVRYYSVAKDCYGSELSQFTVGLYTHDHEYEEIITPATLTKDGKISKICKECKEELQGEAIYSPKEITLSADNFEFNGNIQKPTVTVKDTKGNTLTEGTDYTLTFFPFLLFRALFSLQNNYHFR